MNFGNLLYNVPGELKRLYRKLEGNQKKVIRAKWSIAFNNVCLRENILPNYTRIRHHDPGVANTSHTLGYRAYLIEREIKLKEKQIEELSLMKSNLDNNISRYEYDTELKNSIQKALDLILHNCESVQKSVILKKLNNLYKGQFFLKNEVNYFVNLSDHKVTPSEKEFLNLGLNYHLQPKYDKLHKQTELEVLYSNLIDLEREKKITVNPRIVDLLSAESTKHRNTYYRSSVTPQLKAAAKTLKDNTNVVIRKADKSSVYVLLNKQDYLEKLNGILADTSKFQRINKDPTNQLKQKANNLISTLNAAKCDIHMPKIIGDFNPGYLYGNVKIHKPNNPLRPIISQVLTPTYQLAKTINKIISPFIPHQYTLKSTNDFIDLLHDNTCEGSIASLDVESLFTNVPIDPTIDIILQHTYSHKTLPPPKIPKEILKQMLELCTKEAPFRSPDGNLYLQIEGVAMGSPLGPTFANFYMGHLEEQIFENGNNKPSIYARYVDDIFVQVNSVDQLIELKEKFQRNSVLNFTYELHVDNKLPFLDVMVTSTNTKFDTKVYHKPTNYGTCLNANSECVDKYKDSVVVNYLNRAYRVTNSWQDFHLEVVHIKQMLVNNNYTNTKIDQLTNNFINTKITKRTASEQDVRPLNIYYNNQMHKNYRIEERVLKDLICTNIKCTNPNQRVNVVFYYKNRKTANLIMKNNLNANPSVLQQTNVVYNFTCPLPHCKAEQYIGLTQTTLSRRLAMHTQTGSIFQHFKNNHQTKPTRNQLADNTTIMARAENRFKLSIKEALLILHNAPSINKQFDNFTSILKLHAHRNNGNIRDNTLKVVPCSSNQSAILTPCTTVGTSQDSFSITTTCQVNQTYPTHSSPLLSQQNSKPHPTSSVLIPSTASTTTLLDYNVTGPALPLSQNFFQSVPPAIPHSTLSSLPLTQNHVDYTSSAPPKSQNHIHLTPTISSPVQKHIHCIDFTPHTSQKHIHCTPSAPPFSHHYNQRIPSATLFPQNSILSEISTPPVTKKHTNSISLTPLFPQNPTNFISSTLSLSQKHGRSNPSTLSNAQNHKKYSSSSPPFSQYYTHPNPSSPLLSQSHMYSIPSTPPLSQYYTYSSPNSPLLTQSYTHSFPSIPLFSQYHTHSNPSSPLLSQSHFHSIPSTPSPSQYHTHSNPSSPLQAASTPQQYIRSTSFDSPSPPEQSYTSGTSLIFSPLPSQNHTMIGNKDHPNHNTSENKVNLDSSQLTSASSKSIESDECDLRESSLLPRVDSTLTISQRIRGLVRHARKANNYGMQSKP